MTGILLVALAILDAVAGASITSPPTVTWSDGTVSARFEGVPVDEAVAALARATGVEFRGELQDQRDIHASFDRVGFREVVDRLVGEQNFTITYDTAGRPRRVDLLGMPEEPRGMPQPPPSIPPPPAQQGSPTGFGNLVNGYGPVDLPPFLATALGTPQGELPWLLRQGFLHRDPAVGAAAASLFTRTVETDPMLHGALLRTDDDRLKSILRIWAGLGLEGLVATLATEARDPLVRSKARRLQRQLSVRPPAGASGR